jgi:hypothetical protein
MLEYTQMGSLEWLYIYYTRVEKEPQAGGSGMVPPRNVSEKVAFSEK